MMGGDDGSPFDKIFQDFFGPSEHGNVGDFMRQMDEMMQQINTMLQNPGDLDISIGYHPPPQLPGNRPPPYKESPRDFMLKDPHETGPTVSSDVDTTSPVPAIQNPSPPEPLIFSRRFKFPSFFGGGSEFKGPFASDQPEFQSTEGEPCGCQDNMTWSSTSSFSSQSVFNSGEGWTGTQIQTVRHPDGSVERIEKKTENGRTCTTVTRTDPSGVTSTSTTCDLPAISDKPGTTGSPVLTDPADLSSATRKPADITLPSNPDVNSKEPGFFSKMFGFKFFKPRDE